MKEDLSKKVLGVGISCVDYNYAVAEIIGHAISQSHFAVSALAVHGVMTGVLDREHRYRLNSLDMVVPDGQPVRWALNWLHKCSLRDRVYGPNLMLEVCKAAADRSVSVFLFGSTEEVLKRLSDNLLLRFPGLRIAGVRSSRFRTLSNDEKLALVEEIKASGAGIVFVGLGCPRQEVWVYEFRDLLNMPLLAVGAAFDFHAGLLKQAPAWMQRHGLEWLYRLMMEPRRLWRRYIFLNPLYLLLVLMQKTRILYLYDAGLKPSREKLFG